LEENKFFMKAKFIFENINFERDQDHRESIGLSERGH